jgi:nitric oxide reductase NorE protein
VSTLSRVRVVTTDRVEPRRLPGVDGVWVFIGADSVIFAILFLSFMQDRLKHPALFEASRHTLNMHLGGIDTLILLTSSWSVALAVQAMKRDQIDREPRLLLGGAVTGLMFMVSKSVEYFQKFAHGITPGTNPFYMWYFTLTGIHLAHVAAGTSLLTYLWVRSRRGTYDHLHRAVPESVASFWHLVDLLWVVLFPLLYLMRAA